MKHIQELSLQVTFEMLMYIFRWIFRYQLYVWLCLVQVTAITVELMVICCTMQSLSRHEFKVATWWKSWHSALSLAKAKARDETKKQILDKHRGQGPVLVQHICIIFFLAATSYDWTSISLPSLPEKNVWKHVPQNDNRAYLWIVKLQINFFLIAYQYFPFLSTINMYYLSKEEKKQV